MVDLFGLDKVSAHSDDLELLTTAYDRTYLAIVKSILTDAEIPFLTKDRGSGAAVRVIMGYSMFGADIFVPKALYETALALITPQESDGNEEKEEIEKDEV
jgi:hypothetical protein